LTLKPDFEKLFVGNQTMKTKALLLTAILTVAGTAGLMAQTSNVYSQNIVGYVSQIFPQGYSILGNQMNATDNKITSIIPTAPDNTAIYKFNPQTGSYIVMTYFAGAGWFGDDDNMTFAPGEAGWIHTDVRFTNTFVGEVKLNSTNQIKVGYQIIGSTTPLATNLTALSFPAADNTAIYKYNPTSGGYIVDTYFDGAGWFGDTTDGTKAPNVVVGEGYWIYSPVATNWVQSLVVGP